MEIDAGTIISAITTLAGVVGTAIATLFRAQSKAKDELVLDLRGTIEYEREEKHKYQESLEAHLLQTREILSDLVSMAETIEPVVTSDGGRTRDKVAREADRAIKEISNELRSAL